MPLVSDPDFTLYVGDALTVLEQLEAGSVDCCVTSPPYWGLRDYGTGSWAGGDPDCAHVKGTSRQALAESPASNRGGAKKIALAPDIAYGQTCGKCGATRTDAQLGLEPTPAAYVAGLVAVFEQVRRVLADHGTLWLNLGDSYYAAGWESRRRNEVGAGSFAAEDRRSHTGVVDGLKVKDLVGIPWRVAFALQDAGWYLRSDIIWAKPNPMPESVTDRPTKAHEYVFLLSKRPRYYFDQEAVREAPTDNPGGAAFYARKGLPMPDYSRRLAKAGQPREGGNDGLANQIPIGGVGRNVRSVWEIATQPYAEAHFATFPEELPRRCIAAGCPEWVCATCGKARERLLERKFYGNLRTEDNLDGAHDLERGISRNNFGGQKRNAEYVPPKTTGWSDCGHDDYRPGVVLDPFMGSGTTALVARKLGRRSVGIELSPDYADLAGRRLQQLSLLA